MKQISPVKRRSGRTKPVPQVAPYENDHVTRIERLLMRCRLMVRIEDPQDVKRCKTSPPTEACIPDFTAVEMKTQVFLLTQRMMQAEDEGRTEEARSLQGLIRTFNETL
ncbi:hypothetical protein SARC_05791 [Sphaeroforma arctica JP610]|uniref:Uncharacterized protein n=1 Tax=Sphaeroforma arctica JP610 TaxID=667725 RepID=A0A0L0FZA9_9EUKA|nr:hypothetical protein SARC_05791 [Sphaeroforma arctica JP610]KNC81901.1 hypothetical protein SARC_05791 [Sphaeroforma arctica JP610]|eukprot:XP_014155803.1 hypothetical protein SARC_05791 [Sphaeroforma arctica JP610]